MEFILVFECTDISFIISDTSFLFFFSETCTFSMLHFLAYATRLIDITFSFL